MQSPLTELRAAVDAMLAAAASNDESAVASGWSRVPALLARTGFQLDEWKADKAVRERDLAVLQEIVSELEELQRRRARRGGMI